MQQENIIPKVRFSEPRRNLPGYKGGETAEDHFTNAFSRAYIRDALKLHRTARYDSMALVREVPINGHGIADVVAVAWQQLAGETFPTTEAFAEVVRPCTRAFECKLANWRQAISQASRYNFFANQAIVVLPERICKNAIPYLDTFHKIRVGLWGYASDRDCIYMHYTPRPTKPRLKRYHIQAINHVATTSKQALPIS
jgi:hypothetical protein